MKIGMTTDQPLSFPHQLDTTPLGAGGQIQLHHLARALVGAGYQVEVLQSEGSDSWRGVQYVDYNQGGGYDVLIAYGREPALWSTARYRVAFIQCDNHWMPVDPADFDGIDKVVCCGEILRDHYLQYMDKAIYIPNGYDGSRCFADPLQRKPQSICFSAAPTHGAGLHTALSAIAQIQQSLPVEFHIYGSMSLWNQPTSDDRVTSDDEYGRQLRSQIQDSTGIYVHGALPYHQMLRAYTKHSIMIHPKTYETFGCSLVEAMAAGVVPIVSNLHACIERVTDGVTGFACDYQDVDAFAGYAMRLIRDADLRQRVSAATATAAQAFTFEKVAAIWDATLKECVDVSA
jgi:glycosyltransferase involved in cell wall biosynthesis